MRYSLLDHLACPACFGPLLCVTEAEIPSVMPVGRPSGGIRISAGRGIGPAPAWSNHTELTSLLDRLAGATAPVDRGDEVEVESGLLICGCGRWFPIEHGIPELLPDHLRDDGPRRRFPRRRQHHRCLRISPTHWTRRPTVRPRPPPTRGSITRRPRSVSPPRSPTRRSSRRATARRSRTGTRISPSICSSSSVPSRRCFASPRAIASSTAAAATRGRRSGCSDRGSIRSEWTSAVPTSKSGSSAWACPDRTS